MRGHIVTMFALTGIAALALTFWVGIQLSPENEPWDPLGEFPVQKVITQTAETVTVEGTKCYDEEVTVVGAISWRSVDPLGTTVETGVGSVHRMPGCITQTFENTIPDAVLAAAERGVKGWVINGSETPVDDVQGRTGVPRGWTTETFYLD